MENVTKIALSRAVGLQREMAIVANNVANMNTTGFKGEAPLFTEFLVEPRKDESYSMVQDKATVRDLSNGPITNTGNTLDVALEGNGYFALDTLNGPRYTRAGNFTLDSTGTLVNAGGLPVLDTNGNRINLPARTKDITIGEDGTIATETGPVARIQVVRFDVPQKLIPVGNTLYATDEKPIADEATTVRQGALEGSNVQGVVEMTKMIDVARSYETVQKILQAEHERLRNAYAKLSRLS